MKLRLLTLAPTLMLASLLVLPANAQILYIQVNVSIPLDGSYDLDLNGDGVTDFTVKSKFLQGYCQGGDEDIWSLTVIPTAGNDVVITEDQIGSSYAAALLYGVPVDAGQNFYPGVSLAASLYWGSCGIGVLGEWLNLPNRYLGLRFRASDGTVHYAWAKLSAVAYLDQHGDLHTSTLLMGYAYQVSPGVGISAGAT